MKDNTKKGPGPCHQEHIQVLHHLTDTLKDELKRGLTLLDNCVNQLAQAKWILINVERTMEDFYTDCPACDGAPRGSRATTPPSALTVQPSANAVGKKSSKTKKASVLPMVSGHTVQRPKINIARVDARTSKKSKRTESASGSGRGRSRGSAAATAATAESESNTPEATTPSRKKLKPGPRSRTRIIATGGIPSSSFVGGNDVSVDIEDIGHLLDGRDSFKGFELSTFMGDSWNQASEPVASTSGTALETGETEKKTEKKRKYDSSDDEKDSTTTKKKTEDQGTKSKSSFILKSSSTAAAVKPEIMKSLIQQTFLKFTKGKPSLKKDGSTPIPSTSQKSNDKKGNLSDDEESHASTKSVDKKEKSDRNTKGKKSVTDDESNNDSDDENLASIKSKKGRGATTSKKTRKKNSSDDDSDYQVSQSAKKSSPPKRARKSTAKVISGNMSDDSSDDAFSSGRTKQKSGRVEKNLKDSSDDSSTETLRAKQKKKSPARRSSLGKDENKSTSSRRESKEDKSTDRRRQMSSESPERPSKSPERKVAPPAKKVNIARRTGGKPGPKSVKLRELEKEKEREKKDEDDMEIKNGPKSKKSSGPITSAVVFSDSDDSDNSVLRSTIKNIPLDLQDAIRSPSPQNNKDIFGKLLSTYKDGSPPQNGS